MKNGQIEASLTVTDAELAEINKFTRRSFAADEIYTFSVVLCDNDVDRDFERFTVDALNKLATLFVGKTGIADHSGKSSDQCARIYFCEVITDQNRKTVYGEPYTYIKAKAYMPKTEKFSDLITEIDAGIKKEVSVGCQVAKRVCSVCGSDAALCNHKKGRHYRKNGSSTLCSHELENPTDAYEWSFVAVPAQRGAGVTKKLDASCQNADEIIKSVKNGSGDIPAEYSAVIAKYIGQLEEKATAAEEYLELEKARVVALVCEDLSEKQAKVIRSAINKMSAHELFSLYKSTSEDKDTLNVQLYSGKQKINNKKNQEFII